MAATNNFVNRDFDSDSERNGVLDFSLRMK